MSISSIAVSLKVPLSILLRLAESFTLESEWHDSNALCPISVTESGMSIDLRVSHHLKAHSPIFSKVVGNFTTVSLVQLKKAPKPILVTDAGISMLFNSSQCSNALSGISVAPSGIIAFPFLISNSTLLYTSVNLSIVVSLILVLVTYCSLLSIFVLIPSSLFVNSYDN